MRAASKDKSDYLTDNFLSMLEYIRKNSGETDTKGLSNSEISNSSMDESLKEAITQAHQYHSELRDSLGSEILMKKKKSL